MEAERTGDTAVKAPEEEGTEQVPDTAAGAAEEVKEASPTGEDKVESPEQEKEAEKEKEGDTAETAEETSAGAAAADEWKEEAQAASPGEGDEAWWNERKKKEGDAKAEADTWSGWQDKEKESPEGEASPKKKAEEENAGHEEAAGHEQEEVPQEPPAPPREITEVEEVTIPRDKVAKFYEVGTIGTKPFMPPRKRVSLVSGATITAPEGAEEGKEDVTYTVSSESPLITRRALKYIKLLLHNSDWVPEGEAEDDGDLTMLEVPESVYNFVLGKQGAFLHTICEEANALAFFLKKPLEPSPVATGPPKPVAPWLDVGKHIEVRVSPDHRQPHEKGVILEVLKGNALKIKLASEKIIELSASIVRPHFQAEDSVLVMDKRLGERPVDGTVVSTEKDTVTVKIEGKEDGDELKEITVEHSAVRFRQLPKAAEEEGDEEKEKEKESVPEHRIAIFGDVKARVFVQAKLMASVEKKLPGFYQNKHIVWGSAEEPWGVNRIELSEDFLPQCIGSGGSMKRKLAAASGAVIEYFEDAPIYALVIGPETSRIVATGLIEALRTAERGTIKGVPDELLPFTTVVEVPEDCTAWVTGKGRCFQNGVEEKENVLTFWDKPLWEADDSKNDSKSEWKNEWKSDWKKDTSAAAPASSSGAAAAADTNASSFSYEKYKKDQDAGEEEDEADDQAKPTAEEGGSAAEKAQDNPQEEGETEEPQEDTKVEKESAAQGATEETQGEETETKTEKEEEKEAKDEKTDLETDETKVEKEEGEKEETKTEKDEAKEQKDGEEQEPKEADKEAEEGAETKEEEQWEEETKMVKLIIVGFTERSRQMAALRVQASVEQKHAGFFFNGDDVQHEEEGLATDVLTIDKDMLRWVTGKAGSNRKKIQAASGCGLEFTDSRAIMVGTLAERQRCREYLEWMILQSGSKNRVVSLPKSAESRDDVLVMMLTPKEQSCLDNNALSTIETETDCFIVYREILDDEFYSPGSVITMTLGNLTKYAEVQSVSTEDGVQGLRFKEVFWTEALDKTVPLMIFGHEEGRDGYTGRRLAEFQVQKWLRAAQGGAHAADQDWQEGQGESTWKSQGAAKGDTWGQKKDQGSGSGGNMSWDNWQKGAATKEVTKSNWDTEKNESGGGGKWGGGQGESSWGGGGSGKRGGGGDWGAESGAGRGARGGDSSWEQSGTGGGSKWGGNKDKEDWSTTAGSGQRGSGGWGGQGQSGSGRVRSDPTPWGTDSSTAGGGGRKGDQGNWGKDEAATSTSRRGAGGDQGGWGNADSTANGSGRRGGGEGGWDKGDSAANGTGRRGGDQSTTNWEKAESGTGRRGGDQWAKDEGATAKQTRGGDWGAAETSTGGRRGGDQGKWGGGAVDMSATLATPRRGDQSWAQPSTGRSSGGGGGASWGEGASAPAAGRRGGESGSWESPAAAAQWPQGAAAAAASTTAASWDGGRNRSTQAAPSTEQLWASYKPGTAAASKADTQGGWEQDKQSARGAGAGGWAGGNASKGAPQTGSANSGGWSAW